MENLKIAKLNQYPYFLWINKTVSFKKEKDSFLITDIETGNVTESNIEEVSKIEIFLMKHLPIILIVYYVWYLPSFIPFVLGVIVSLIATVIIKYLPRWFKKYVFLLCLGGLYMAFNDMEILFEHSLYVVVNYSILFFLFFEIYGLIKTDKYFYLTEFESSFKVDGTRALPGKTRIFRNKIPWFSLTANRKRVNLFNFSMNGYYLRVKEWELNNE